MKLKLKQEPEPEQEPGQSDGSDSENLLFTHKKAIDSSSAIYLGPVAGVLVLDVLGQVGDLLVELEVGGLQLGDPGNQALDPRLGL